MLVHRYFLVRIKPDPEDSHEFLLKFHLDVLGIHLRCVLTQGETYAGIFSGTILTEWGTFQTAITHAH